MNDLEKMERSTFMVDRRGLAIAGSSPAEMNLDRSPSFP